MNKNSNKDGKNNNGKDKLINDFNSAIIISYRCYRIYEICNYILEHLSTI